ncbi:MAG: two-component regulator propeller domain-containing protein, partial [Candidatus Latescibacter sp.]|nr:two-component regulator propeller domain-containing protein [Candidatus Latescibacter sp.]
MKTMRTIIISTLLLLLYGNAFAEGIWTPYLTHIDSLDVVNAIAIEGDSLWVGTNGGVVLWDIKKKTFKVFTTADGLADNSISTITIDHRGVKWIGSIGGDNLGVFGPNHMEARRYNISAFDGSRWINYDRDTLGLSGDQPGNLYYAGRINSIAVDAYDTVLIGVMETYTTNSRENSIDEFHIVMKDQSGKWKVIYSTSGYYIGSSIVLLNDIQDNNIIWNVSGNALRKIIRPYSSVSPNILPMDPIELGSLAIDNNYNIWVGGGGVIIFYDRNSLLTFKSDITGITGFCRAISIDRNNVKWFGSNIGITSFDSYAWKTYAPDWWVHPSWVYDLNSDNVWGLSFDKYGYLWVGTNKGLYR